MLVTIAVVGSLLLSGQAAAQGAIDRVIEQRMEDARIVGLGAAVIVNKEVVWTKGYGFADLQHYGPWRALIAAIRVYISG